MMLFGLFLLVMGCGLLVLGSWLVVDPHPPVLRHHSPSPAACCPCHQGFCTAAMSFLVFLLVHDSPSAAAAAKADAAEAPVPEPAEGEQLSGLASLGPFGGWGYHCMWITRDDYT